jgi:hypothetical protein
VAEERWVEVWSGEDPSVPGRLLDEAGIEMRIAARSWGAHGGGAFPAFNLISLFRKKPRPGSARLLVAQSNQARAKTLLRAKEPEK